MRSRKRVWLPAECFYCEREISSLQDHTYDHVQALSKGGKNSLSNMVDCCFRCNQLKADKSLKELRTYLKEQLLNCSPKAPQYDYFQSVLKTVEECLDS